MILVSYNSIYEFMQYIVKFKQFLIFYNSVNFLISKSMHLTSIYKDLNFQRSYKDLSP